MTANNGWLSKPGVPLNPEQDGWHWVSGDGGDPEPFYWNGIWRGSDQFSYYSLGESCRYFGPVLSHDEATALQARVAELEGALRNIAADCESDCPPSHGAIKYAIRAALEGKKDD